ncbi:MAG TPA: glycosyltransferase family 39 protein [Candidatus Saccharimonadales bacterium]|jgi:hypothetical protein|nr:glycosyltransferase family 39 protein [Candidatus Saccharimonadales bacterium]
MASLFLSTDPASTRVPRRTGSRQAAAPAHPGQRDQFRMERTFALLFVLVAAGWLRMLQPLYSTAYMDESIYVAYGRMFLGRHFEAPLSSPLQWSFGWYLWPAMAAAADWLGGLFMLREMAALLGVITVAATWGFASRVFSKAIGLGAAAVMAMIAPAVLVSRIATRDSGSICFFALGLWAFAVAWREDRKRGWALAALCFFAAFLCKYLVAVYFPLLVIAALWKGRRPMLFFSAPLFAACAAYGALHFHDLLHLLQYGAAYRSLQAPAGEAWNIYVRGRVDFYILAVAALPALVLPKWRVPAAMMLAGVAIMLLVQWKTRADFDYWKHVNYELLFLAPLAVAGLLLLVEKLWSANYTAMMLAGISGVLALALGAAWVGKTAHINQFVFWPNVDPILAYFEGRLKPNDRVLADDTVFRYYFNPPLHQGEIVDPMYFEYRGLRSEHAYMSAVADGAFTYVVLDGGIGEETRRMDAAIRPLLGGYQLEMLALEPTLGQKIEIYARPAAAPVVENSVSIRLLTPANNAIVVARGEESTAEGTTTGAASGWFVQLEVFTDRWYQQGGNIPVATDGSFRHTITLGGQGRQQCYHLLRARLFDAVGQSRAVAINSAVARANPDGSPPACRVERTIPPIPRGGTDGSADQH